MPVSGREKKRNRKAMNQKLNQMRSGEIKTAVGKAKDAVVDLGDDPGGTTGSAKTRSTKAPRKKAAR